MKPRKKSNFEYFVAAGLLLIVVFFSLHIGMAITEAQEIEAEQGFASEGFDSLNLIMDCLNTRLADSSLSFAFGWNENVQNSLLWGCFIWFILAAYWFTSKRKYIAGKEYGTAEWGSLKDIQDLFAVTIMNKEIAQAKRVKNFVGRYFEKRKVINDCRKCATKAAAIEMSKLDSWKADNFPKGRSLTQEQKQERKRVLKEYASRKKEIEEQAEVTFSETLAEAWKPIKLKKQYELDMLQIAEQYQQGLVISTTEEKEKAQAQAKERYESALSDFYNGSSRIEKIKKKYENADAFLTKTERVSIYNYVLNNNICVIGGSGAGKTRGFVMPNILQAHSSYVVTDPKGEILEKSGYFLEKIHGYKIAVLNLDNKAQSNGYNPFVYIHPDRAGYEERVLSLIETIIVNTNGGENKGASDPFWEKAERLFLQAIFFFVCDGYVEEERNMNTVMKLIAMLEIGEEEDERNSELDRFVDFFAELHGEEHIGVQQYREFRGKASGKTAKSIVISAVARLAPFRASEVQRIFSYDDMHLERLGEEKTIVFVVVPPTDTTFNFVAGMLFSQMFQELQYCATQTHKHDGQRLPVPVRFILDEFANTCVIPQFTKILAYARSFGIGIVPILQSLEQIKNAYKDEWGVILDNCNAFLYLGGVSHYDTLDYISKLLGKGTFDKKTTGRTRGRSGSSSQNFDVIGRDLMDTAEIRKIPKKDCLLVLGGRNPFYSEKYLYESHPNYQYTSDANHKYSYDYCPPPPPKTDGQIKSERQAAEDGKWEAINQKAAAVKATIDANTDAIQMNTDTEQLVGYVAKEHNHLVIISDNLLDEDNEADEEILKTLDLDGDGGLSEVLGALKKEIDEKTEAEKVELSTDTVKVAKDVVEAIKNDAVEPIADDLLDDEDEYEFETDEAGEADNELGDLSQLIESVEEVLNEAEAP